MDKFDFEIQVELGDYAKLKGNWINFLKSEIKGSSRRGIGRCFLLQSFLPFISEHRKPDDFELVPEVLSLGSKEWELTNRWKVFYKDLRISDQKLEGTFLYNKMGIPVKEFDPLITKTNVYKPDYILNLEIDLSCDSLEVDNQVLSLLKSKRDQLSKKYMVKSEKLFTQYLPDTKLTLSERDIDIVIGYSKFLSTKKDFNEYYSRVLKSKKWNIDPLDLKNLHGFIADLSPIALDTIDDRMPILLNFLDPLMKLPIKSKS